LFQPAGVTMVRFVTVEAPAGVLHVLVCNNNKLLQTWLPVRNNAYFDI
jgi:hypothetical protein